MGKLPQQVVDTQAKGQVLELTGDDQTYYFKKPGQADLDRYLALIVKKKLSLATKNLVFDLAVHPDKETLAAQFDEKPGRMVALAQALQEAVGLTEEFAVKKL